jgi:glycosyltransferase involved in cell wall biosynthesis
MRYIWEQAPLYFNRERFSPPVLLAIRWQLAQLRRWDRSIHPDRYIAISACVAERIRRLYGMDSAVIHPPVDLARLPGPSGEKDRGYYLIVSALAPYKRIGDAIDACRLRKRRLVIVGTGEEERRLRSRAGPETQFLGWLKDDQVGELYRHSRALLLPGEEDFGITPLEAMACGRPVVALGRGGATETVVDPDSPGGGAPTGILYPEAGPQNLAHALERFEKLEGSFDPSALRAHAERFDRPRFRRQMRQALEEFASTSACDGRREYHHGGTERTESGTPGGQSYPS